MKTSITINEQEITVTAKFIDFVPQPWGTNTNNMYSPKFKLSIGCDGKKATFDFFGSHNDAVTGKKIMTDADLLSAFEMIVSDAILGGNSFEDFCSELGYDSDSRSAEKTWKACIKSSDKLCKLFDSFDFDLYTVSSRLQELEENR